MPDTKLNRWRWVESRDGPLCPGQSPTSLQVPGSVDLYSHLSADATAVALSGLLEPIGSDRQDSPIATCIGTARCPCDHQSSNPAPLAGTALRREHGPISLVVGRLPDLPKSFSPRAASTL